ncbi:uncharacterized protein LOC143275989 isoform X2 [Babylonia areolata]|uniref:uncharacterized protein LOC143275989 isoform X2 n=1 Tax=Babylonia areolata TaxID=304850 RepID=UPI003FD374C6
MGSRIRECPDKLFELFVEIGNPQCEGKGPVVLRKYPPDFDQQDVLTEIPKFAFPCKSEILQVEQFVFVLTDMEGMFRYVYCRHGPRSNTCLCIMSHLCWFDIFYKMLNFLAEIENGSEENDPSPFLEATFMQDIPMPGIPVTIVAGRHMLNFTAPKPDQLPSIPTSRNLTEYYNAVDANNMMKIFASMLHERRIIITSKKLSRITACVHASEALLFPMHWQHLFIPLLPSHVVDMVTAPMPYLIGVPSSLMEVIERKQMDLGDAVIVDADRNKVRSEYDDLEALPDNVSSYLKRQLKTQKVQTSMMESGDAVSWAFLSALVRLISGYRDGLKFYDDGPITFDGDAFVQSSTSRSTQVFLEKMLQLQIFQQFISGRLDLLNSGQGFSDVFEQESIKYYNHVNTQSKYKEWLAKKTRKLKMIDLKDKMNVQRKRMMSRLREFNENFVSARYSFASGFKPSGSRPPSRPPPPSASALRGRSSQVSHRSTVYKTVVVEDKEEDSGSSHGDSFSLVDVTTDTNDKVKMTMTRSPVVDDLFSEVSFFLANVMGTGDGDTTPTSSSKPHASSSQDPPTASSSHDHASSLTSAVSRATSDAAPAVLDAARASTQHHHADRLITTDRLIARDQCVTSKTYGDGSEATASRQSPKEKHSSDRLIVKDRLITGRSSRTDPLETPPPVPVKRKGEGQRGETPTSPSSQPQAPPIPRPRTASMKKVREDGSPPPPPLPRKVQEDQQPETPLIQFESNEEGVDQFDPLASRDSPMPVERGKETGPDGGESGPQSSLGLSPRPATVFMRSATYRRALEDRPLYPDDGPLDNRTQAAGDDKVRPVAGSSGFDPLVPVSTPASAAWGEQQSGSTDTDSHKGVAVKTGDGVRDPVAELLDLDPQSRVFEASTVGPHTPQSTARIGVLCANGIEQRPSSSDNVPSNHSALGSGLSAVSGGSDPFFDPTTTTSTTAVSSPALELPSLHPPPLVPRPRPRNSVQATKSAVLNSTSSASPHQSLSPPARPSLPPKPSPHLTPQRQEADPLKDLTGGQQQQHHHHHSKTDPGALKDLMGLDTGGGGIEAPMSKPAPGERGNPKPIQRASVAALMKQFDRLGSEGAVARPSSPLRSHLTQSHPPAAAAAARKQWETFE